MTGHVTRTLAARIRQQVESRGLVVWFDPQGDYQSVVESLDLGGAALQQYRGSFFELRHDIEPHVASDERPLLVVYVPMAQNDTEWALCEATAAGVVMEPGRQPPAHNTRLAVVARAALADRLPKTRVEAIVKAVEEGRLSLAELDALAERGSADVTGALSLVFKTEEPAELALRFLSDSGYDAALKQKDGAAALVEFLGEKFAVSLVASPHISELRGSFARLVLMTELDAAAGGDIAALGDFARVVAEPGRNACIDLVRTWRNRRDLQDGYVTAANQVESALGLAEVSIPTDRLKDVEVFRCYDDALYDITERHLSEKPDAETLELAEQRQQSLWATVDPRVMERWALLASAARVRLTAQDVEVELQGTPQDVGSVFDAYRHGDGGGVPWAILDTHQRNMETSYYQVEPDLGGADTRARVIAAARADYMRVASKLAEHFSAALSDGGLKNASLPRQLETFRRHVAPELDAKHRVAYILVDALRYEMADKLAESLGDAFDCDVEATLGTLPSITEVGMAALLPHADQGAELVDAGKGKVAVQIGDRVLRNRKDRMAYLAGTIDGQVEEIRLEDLVPPSTKTRAALGGVQLLCVTATEELDGLCEKGNVAMARRLMDDVLLQLRRGIRVLVDLGFDRVVVTADHGFLFVHEVEEGLMIDPPGGKTVDLHRRAWVGTGGTTSQGLLRLSAKDAGLGGALDIAVPRSLAIFRSPGASATYFHGGASLQELVIPVLTIRPAHPSVATAATMHWKLRLGSPTISTRFLSVQIEGAADGLFGVATPRVRVEVREGKSSLSQPVAASYGFDAATGLVQIRAGAGRATELNTVTLMLRETPTRDTVRVVLLDADTERVLASIDDVSVTIADF